MTETFHEFVVQRSPALSRTVLVTVGLLYASRQRIALWLDDRRVRRARRAGG
ncbi:hypothetical protein ACWEOS_08320 [Micromonospora taraxaci]